MDPELRRRAIFIFGATAIAAAILVALSLRRETPRIFTPTSAEPREVGAALVGPTVYVVDARAENRWRHFDFSRGALVSEPRGNGWDLAFRRFTIIGNGGDGFAGHAGIRDLGTVPFGDVAEVPADGYLDTRVRSDSTHPAIADWYDYGFSSHLLTPRNHVYAVRTADGRYAKLRILGYYCPGPTPGCLAFEYVYQGDGSRRVDTRSNSPSAPDLW